MADDAAGPEATVTEAHDGQARAALVAAALTDLNERERLIIRKRKLEEEAVTLETLGEWLGKQGIPHPMPEEMPGEYDAALLEIYGTDPAEVDVLNRIKEGMAE